MSQIDSPTFGRGIEDKDTLPLFYRGMQLKLHNCGVTLPKNAKLLEVGSGNGNFLNYLHEQGLDVEGVDMQPRGPGVKKADIAKLPYDSESFDCVLSKQVFDDTLYEQNQKAMLSEIVRVLKKGGVYYAVEQFFEPIEGLELIPDPTSDLISSVYRKR